MWEGWMEITWKELTHAHAREPLTDSEFRQRHGLWKDRKLLPGKNLYGLVQVMQRPGHGRMH